MAQTMRKVAGPLRGRCSPYLSRPRVVRVRAVASEPRAVVSTNGTVPVTFTADWSPDSWRRKHAYQQPNYPDKAEVLKACGDIKSYPPLIFAGECRNLQERLAKAAVGEAFILQGGDCAEAFTQFTANRIRDTYRVLLQMSVVMMFGGGVPVIKLGRMAGQFAKPRTADLEEKDGKSLPSYRGDIINGPEFTAEARVPDPWRLVRAYNQSAATLNLLRGFSTGGYAGLTRIASWNLDFMSNSDEGKAYMDLVRHIRISTRERGSRNCRQRGVGKCALLHAAAICLTASYLSGCMLASSK
eukprot:GHRR01030273.1.p1 GENE.GHRR01030273.1~~GHRR01030273.1.p1  ORF type:complete len:299 (+),score=69.36 GHRR01030273.1:318-1214(+)